MLFDQQDFPGALQRLLGIPMPIETCLPEEEDHRLTTTCLDLIKERSRLFASVRSHALGCDEASVVEVSSNLANLSFMNTVVFPLPFYCVFQTITSRWTYLYMSQIWRVKQFQSEAHDLGSSLGTKAHYYCKQARCLWVNFRHKNPVFDMSKLLPLQESDIQVKRYSTSNYFQL